MLAPIGGLHAANARGPIFSLPDFRTLAGGAQQVHLLPGQHEFVFSMYGAPGELESLRQLVGVMREQKIGNGFDPGPGTGPNILFILADQWRAQAFGHAGDPNVRTPHIDTLQRQGIRFINALSSVPVCCPARASLLTGQRALTHGVFLNDVALSPDALTLPKVLVRAGYDTGYIGKWHLNGDGRSAFIPRERRQGFDYWKALECTHDYNHSVYYSDNPEKLVWEGYDAAAQTRDAQRYLRDHAGSKKPFFLFLAWGPRTTRIRRRRRSIARNTRPTG